jgi:hypothetical protein
LGQRIRTVDPAVAASRQIPKAESDSDGAVVWAIGAIPIGETETGSVSVALTCGGRLVGLVGTARGGEAGGIKRQGNRRSTRRNPLMRGEIGGCKKADKRRSHREDERAFMEDRISYLCFVDFCIAVGALQLKPTSFSVIGATFALEKPELIEGLLFLDVSRIMSSRFIFCSFLLMYP